MRFSRNSITPKNSSLCKGTKGVQERESKGVQKIRTHGFSAERDWQKSRKVWVW